MQVNPDDPICLCFHVTRRKVINFIRVEKPKRPSQLSQCFGAGTGCGWCRAYLERLLHEQLAENADNSLIPSAEMTYQEYKRARTDYVLKGGGKPPAGAIPIDVESDEAPK
ncbi:MAG: (2Fe-2S)-binding protein [Mariniblastus sp.]|nr:(2Fe-2S)-binding protein [Mariniblastus sp.]